MLDLLVFATVVGVILASVGSGTAWLTAYVIEKRIEEILKRKQRDD